jgi:OPA family glycerol-3-phosphate transporter-like MFS transporter
MAKEYHLPHTSIGLVLSIFFIVYAVGQIINGTLGNLIIPRKMIAVGLLVSAGLNALFPFSHGSIVLMALVWGLNGYFQSMGWGPTVRVLAHWFPSDVRGSAAGRLGTSYILGSAFSWILASLALTFLKWQLVFWVPALLAAGSATWWYQKASITQSCLEPANAKYICSPSSKDEGSLKHVGFFSLFNNTVRTPSVWFAGMALLGVNIVRYGFLCWAPSYLVEAGKTLSSRPIYSAIAFPLAGTLGAICAGWISDKIFNHKREPAILFMLMVLIVMCFLFGVYSDTSFRLSTILLLGTGFFTFGPHMLLVTALPADAGRNASSIAGFIDGIGYLGAIVAGIGTGCLVDRYGWKGGFLLWGGSAIFAVLATLLSLRFRANLNSIKNIFVLTLGNEARI